MTKIRQLCLALIRIRSSLAVVLIAPVGVDIKDSAFSTAFMVRASKVIVHQLAVVRIRLGCSLQLPLGSSSLGEYALLLGSA